SALPDPDAPAYSKSRLTGLDDQPNRGSILIVDGDIDECRKANRFDASLLKIITSDSDGLDRLVRGPCTDRLHLSTPGLSNDSSDGSRDRARARARRDLEHLASNVVVGAHSDGLADDWFGR